MFQNVLNLTRKLLRTFTSSAVSFSLKLKVEPLLVNLQNLPVKCLWRAGKNRKSSNKQSWLETDKRALLWMMSVSLHASKHIFKCSSEVSWLLTLNVSAKGEMEVEMIKNNIKIENKATIDYLWWLHNCARLAPNINRVIFSKCMLKSFCLQVC